jgi:predicted amidohydrolase
MSKDVAPASSPTVRVAAIQMTAELANVDANLAKAERLVRAAFERGANWVILPEFFSSGNAFHPAMAAATRAIDGSPARLLRDLARQGNAAVGGSFLAWRDGNVYNSFVLALPDGSMHRHDKDYPTFWENCYYIGGNDDGVLPTPQGKVGVALCWELIRSQTAARLKGKVGMVVGGSGWWAAKDSVPPDNPARRLNLEIMKATPARFARMLGVPVVHAAQAGSFVGRSWPIEGDAYPSHYLGEAQIVDGKGRVLARMSREEGEGVITADVPFGPVADEPEGIPERYWIAEFPEAIYSQWESALETGHRYYLSTTLPYVKGLFERPAEERSR